MPQDDKQNLADLLKAMSDGHFAEDESGEDADQSHLGPPPQPAQLPPQAAVVPARTSPRPAVKEAGQQTQPQQVAAPARAARPAAPPQVTVPPPRPMPFPAPSPQPQSQPTVSKRPRVAQKQHLVQSIYFKQTAMPVLLTLGLICLFLVILGRTSGELSPFQVFGRLVFALPTGLMGLLMLGLGVLTALQMRSDSK